MGKGKPTTLKNTEWNTTTSAHQSWAMPGKSNSLIIIASKPGCYWVLFNNPPFLRFGTTGKCCSFNSRRVIFVTTQDMGSKLTQGSCRLIHVTGKNGSPLHMNWHSEKGLSKFMAVHKSQMYIG